MPKGRREDGLLQTEPNKQGLVPTGNAPAGKKDLNKGATKNRGAWTSVAQTSIHKTKGDYQGTPRKKKKGLQKKKDDLAQTVGGLRRGETKR